MTPILCNLINSSALCLLQDSLTVAELCHTLESVLRLATCPMCKETLTPKVAQCVCGHVVCEPCRLRLSKQECPVCRAAFSSVKPTGFIRQLIEALPHPCRHKNCDYLVRTDDDHENFCTYKPTKCHYCKWSGAERDLVDHLKSKHPQFNTYLIPLLGNLQYGVSLDPKKECSVFTPILADGHFFWGEIKNEPSAGKLTAIFHPVGTGKTTTVFVGFVKVGPDDSFSANLKLNMNNVDPYQENCIAIPVSVLGKSTENGEFKYKLCVEVIKTKCLVSFLESGVKTGAALLNQAMTNVGALRPTP